MIFVSVSDKQRRIEEIDRITMNGSSLAVVDLGNFSRLRHERAWLINSLRNHKPKGVA
jgi:uncharacterized protein YjhX (UPF0386 family)